MDELDELIDTQIENSSDVEHIKLKTTKNLIRNICEYLSDDPIDYSPQESVDQINELLKSPDKLNRILYSPVTSYLINLDENERGAFDTNISFLLSYVLNESSGVPKDSCNFAIKIYDHSQLVIHQTENAKVILLQGAKDIKSNFEEELIKTKAQFETDIDNTKRGFKKEIKDVQKEYITILGIFSSVVLTFVADLVFTSSVLENIHQASIYRLVFIVALLGLVIIDTIFILIKFLYDINGRTIGKGTIIYKWFKRINIVGLSICIIVFVSWLFDATGLKEYISNQMCWNE